MCAYAYYLLSLRIHPPLLRVRLPAVRRRCRPRCRALCRAASRRSKRGSCCGAACSWCARRGTCSGRRARGGEHTRRGKRSGTPTPTPTLTLTLTPTPTPTLTLTLTSFAPSATTGGGRGSARWWPRPSAATGPSSRTAPSTGGGEGRGEGVRREPSEGDVKTRKHEGCFWLTHSILRIRGPSCQAVGKRLVHSMRSRALVPRPPAAPSPLAAPSRRLGHCDASELLTNAVLAMHVMCLAHACACVRAIVHTCCLVHRRFLPLPFLLSR